MTFPMLGTAKRKRAELESVQTTTPASSRKPAANLARRVRERLLKWVRHRSDIRAEIAQLESEVIIKVRPATGALTRGPVRTLTAVQEKELKELVERIGDELRLEFKPKHLDCPIGYHWTAFSLMLAAQPKRLH